MTESKIELTERLRREGRWAEASRFKDVAIKEFRAKGTKRTEATEAAWEAMAKAYPPLAPVALAPMPAEASAVVAVDAETGEVDDEAIGRLTEIVKWDIDHWCRFHGINVTTEAIQELGNTVVDIVRGKI